MGKTKRVPELRFKGFEGEWEERKYSETFSFIPNNTLSRAELNFIYGLAKNVHYGDVLIKFGELLDVQKDEIPYITKDILVNKMKSSELRNGDVIIADTAEDETVGKCTELVNVSEEIVFSGLHTIPSRPILHFSLGYLGYFMNSPAYHDQLFRLMQGTKVSSISKAILLNTSILYPSDSVEQTQIGSFFQNLDALIALHQRKHDKLCAVKKAMLEKMFPKEGADVPELRFKGFTGKWEEKELSMISQKIGSGKTPKGGDSTYVSEGIALLRSQNIRDNIIDFSGVAYITQETDEDMKNSRVMQNDILLNITGASIGRSAVYQFSGLANVNQHVCIIRPINGYNSDFIELNLTSTNGQKKIDDNQAGSGREGLNFHQIGKMCFMFPNIEEQSQIAAFFQHLDSLISLHQRELDKLKNIKKACLEKMFV